jgi:hypothetical protein
MIDDVWRACIGSCASQHMSEVFTAGSPRGRRPAGRDETEIMAAVRRSAA